MTEIDDEDTITMIDVIEREDKLEEEASAVLGNSDEKNCTYSRGYIARQALYSCATCSSKSGQEAAICLACSLECHDNHELYELYTKRNYRCDCGNERFKPDFVCKLVDKQTKKAPLNENNTYNHNFSGRYCSCDHRYPPDENDESPENNDEMWQCIICEDWYHTKHLGASDLPARCEEMACGSCVEKLDFLKFYKFLDKIDESKRRTSKNNDVDSQSGEDTEIVGPFSMLDSRPTSCVGTVAEVKKEDKIKTVVDAPESDTNDSQAENKEPVDAKLENQEKKAENQTSPTSSDCILELLKSVDDKEAQLGGPIFWTDCDWRNELCRCQKCMTIYDNKNCLFLLDEKDTVQYYEAQGKALAKNSSTTFERGLSALNGMNRAAVAEAMNGYDELKADLSVYLRKFADSKKVVREEDIHEFFEQLKSKKRFKLEYE